MSNRIGDIWNNQGIITQGQTGNNTIVHGAVPRRLSDPGADSLKAQILREFPKDRAITVMALVGDGEAIQFADEIHAFLKTNGFTMKEPDGISQGIFSGQVKGLHWRHADATFIVGTNLP